MTGADIGCRGPASSVPQPPDGGTGPSAWMGDAIRREIASARGVCGIGAGREDVPAAYPKQYERLFARIRVRGGRPSPVSPITPAMPPYIRSRFDVLVRFFQTLPGPLPDTEFDIYLGDGFDRWSKPAARPVFAFSKHAAGDAAALLLPDPLSIRDAAVFAADVADGNRRFPWPEKRAIAFWRGSTTGAHFATDRPFRNVRLRLVEIAAERPDLIDAKITGFHPTCPPPVRELIEGLGYRGPAVGLAEHMRCKYLPLLDGFTSPWPRFHWGMFGSSVLFKQCSGLVGWFDAGVSAGEHFVPIAADLSDLCERIVAAGDADGDMQRIAGNAQAFAAAHLSIEKMRAYTAALIEAYAGAFDA